MNCQYCGKKLSMVKKLTHGDFCSVAHRRAFHEEQDRLAVARLIEHQGQIGGGRKKKINLNEVAKAAEQGARKKSATKREEPAALPGYADYLAGEIPARSSRIGILSMDTGLAITLLPVVPERMVSVVGAGQLTELDAPVLPLPMGEAMAELPEALGALAMAQDVLLLADPEYSLAVPADAGCPGPADLQALPVFALAPGGDLCEPQPLLPVPMAVPRAVSMPLAALPVRPSELGYALLLAAEADAEFTDGEDLPLQDLVALEIPSRPGRTMLLDRHSWPMRFHFARRTPGEYLRHPEPAPKLVRALARLRNGIESRPGLAGSRALEPHGFDSFPRLRGVRPQVRFDQRGRWLGKAGALEIVVPVAEPREPHVVASEQLSTWTPLALAAPRTPSQPVAGTALAANEAPTLFPLAFPVAPAAPRAFETLDGGPIPAKPRIASVRRPVKAALTQNRLMERLVPISIQAIESAGTDPRMRGEVDFTPTTSMLPALNLLLVPARSSYSPFSMVSPLAGGNGAWTWEGLKSHWQNAPSDLRLIALAVPLVIAFVVVPKDRIADLLFPKKTAAPVTANASAPQPQNKGFLAQVMGEDSMGDLKKGIQRRAAIELSDDFRQGLGEWSGQGNWADGWNYDKVGFIKPRKLAVYTPTLGLEDYRFEFLGQIERKALSWVFRAADIKNYYAARLEIVRPGPVPVVELVRWAVIQGRAGPKKSIPLPFAVRMDTIYRVRMDVSGSDFVTTVQGKVVDVFSDPRITRGGVGFFSEPGEDSRLRWVEVSHQYDFLGRLCAFLVPYEVSNANVRSGQ